MTLDEASAAVAPGDVVRMASGGPYWTIFRRTETGETIFRRTETSEPAWHVVRCTKRGEFQREVMPAVALIPVRCAAMDRERERAVGSAIDYARGALLRVRAEVDLGEGLTGKVDAAIQRLEAVMPED